MKGWKIFSIIMFLAKTTYRSISKLSDGQLSKVFKNFWYVENALIDTMEKISGVSTNKKIEWPDLNMVAKEIKILNETFDLRKADVCQYGKLPSAADCFLVCPDWKKIAPDYDGAVRKVIDILRRKTNVNIEFREGAYFKEGTELERAWKELREKQDSDYLVFPFQFGHRYSECSPKESIEYMTSREFPLGTFACLVSLLVGLQLDEKKPVVSMYCSGDIVEQCAIGQEEDDIMPFLSTVKIEAREDGSISISPQDPECASKNSGTASGFLV